MTRLSKLTEPRRRFTGTHTHYYNVVAAGGKDDTRHSTMSERHLTSADPLPAYREGLLRLYSMLYCPYAQRARMVLDHKKIKHETVNVNLVDKPAWFLERNPNGQVPILELGDKVLYESAVCMEYLDEIYPGDKLTPSDPYTKARGKILCEEYSRVIAAFYKLGLSKPENRDAALENMHSVLAAFEKVMPETKFLTGQTYSMADYSCWPWTERLVVLEEFMGIKFLKPELYPKFCSWLVAMGETPGVKATRTSMSDMKTFFLGYVSGKQNFDFALKK